MVLELVAIIISLTIFIFLVPYMFLPYKREVKNKLWFTYAWSGHGLVLGIIVLILSLFNLDVPAINTLASSLLIVGGLGLTLLMIAFSLENRKFMFGSFGDWIRILTTHLFMAAVAIWFILITELTFNQLILSWTILGIYFIFMFNKIDIPWLVYKPSKISKKLKKFLIRLFIGIVFVVIPLLSYL